MLSTLVTAALWQTLDSFTLGMHSPAFGQGLMGPGGPPSQASGAAWLCSPLLSGACPEDSFCFCCPSCPNSDPCLLNSEGLLCSVYTLLPCATLRKLFLGREPRRRGAHLVRFPSLRTSVRIVHHLISDFVKCDVIFGGRAGLVPSPLLWPEGEVQLLAGHSLSTFVLECLQGP